MKDRARDEDLGFAFSLEGMVVFSYAPLNSEGGADAHACCCWCGVIRIKLAVIKH